MLLACCSDNVLIDNKGQLNSLKRESNVNKSLRVEKRKLFNAASFVHVFWKEQEVILSLQVRLVTSFLDN